MTRCPAIASVAARSSARSPGNRVVISLEPGDRVVHDTFGMGTVVVVGGEGQRASVDRLRVRRRQAAAAALRPGREDLAPSGDAGPASDPEAEVPHPGQRVDGRPAVRVHLDVQAGAGRVAGPPTRPMTLPPWTVPLVRSNESMLAYHVSVPSGCWMTIVFP